MRLHYLSALPLRTVATGRPANIRGPGALARRSLRRCPPASHTDEPQRWRQTDSHIGRPNASRWCRPDRRRSPTTGRSPQSLPALCLSASPAPFLERRLASQLRVQKEPWRTVRQSRNISSETPLVGSSRSVGSCRANAMFLAFVPGCRVPTVSLKLSLCTLMGRRATAGVKHRVGQREHGCRAAVQ